MSDKKKISDNEDMFLAELDAGRTGEEPDASEFSEEDLQGIKYLDQISKFISNAKPEPGEIPESVDNVVLGHIKEKSREIRREQKVVWLFPRHKWAAAAVMGVLVCVVSFNLVFKMNKSADNSSKDNTISMLAEGSKGVKDIDGNGRVNIIDAYIMDRRLMTGAAMSKKLDLNGDGRIDNKDINTIVKTAVSLGRGEV